MCQNAQKTALELLQEVEPTIASIGQDAGITNNPAFETVLNLFSTAEATLESWQKGDAAQEVIQAINAVSAAVGVLQTTVPAVAPYATLIQVILAGLATVIGVIDANSKPAPVPGSTAAEEAEAEEIHRAHVISDTTSKVKELVPGFQFSIKRSILPGHAPKDQFRKAWNQAVQAGNFHPALHLAA